MIDSQFYMEQLLKPENSLRTTGFEPVPSDCEQQAYATRKREGQASGKCSNTGNNSRLLRSLVITSERREHFMSTRQPKRLPNINMESYF